MKISLCHSYNFQIWGLCFAMDFENKEISFAFLCFLLSIGWGS
jgi:hypothetical protein